MCKKFVLLGMLIFALASLSFVSAAFSASIAPGILNRTITTQVNVTITAATNGSEGNITIVNITLPQTLSLVPNSGISTLSAYTFDNTTNNIWWNTTDSGFENDTTHSFLFNATSQVAGDAILSLNATQVNGDSNTSSFSITVNFAFDGYVKNETGDYQNNTNVTIYSFEEQANGPPIETVLDSVLTDGNGFFRFASINGSSSNYKIKLIYYNETDYSIESANATKVGTVLPPFPAFLYYPQDGSGAYDVSLNGSTFYLQEASTLNLTATNATGDLIRFGYEVVDQLLGFPIESNIKASVIEKQVVVPAGRDYTVMIVREPSQFPDLGPSTCPSAMNETTCPTPPKSNNTLGTLSGGAVTDVSINLSVSKIYVYGCINLETGHNNSDVNVTNIIPRLLPWSGFVVTGMKADDGSINITDNSVNLNNTGDLGGIVCPPNVSAYNISLLANSEYMIEFYAKNASSEAGAPGDAWNLAAFQNISTSSSDIYQNVTLYRLAGAYNETIEKNTSLMTINILNSTGGAITTSVGHVDVKVKHPVFGTVTYIIESITNGSFTLPILNNSDWAKVYLFPDNSPPIERSLNLSNATNSIRLRQIDFSSGGDKGLRTTNSTGDLVVLNVSSNPLELEFFSTRTGCNGIAPPDSCLITEINATNFNPLKALVAGKVNMRLKFTNSGTSLLFHNYDMFSAKQPPMFSIVNAEPTTSSTNYQIWDFGSFAPPDAYENVTIAMPYSDSASASNFINDSRTVYVKLPLLYTEDLGSQDSWTVAWNGTRGDTISNLTDDLIDYNQTAFNSYLTDTGIGCSTTNTTAVCYINTSANIIYTTIPHFSGVSPSISGSNPAGGNGGEETSTSSGGGKWRKTIVLSYRQFVEGVTKELGYKERIRFLIGEEWHQVGVTNITKSSVSLEISSNVTQTATITVGEEKKFELTSDNIYDLSVKLNSITNEKASLSIRSISEEIRRPRESERESERTEERPRAGEAREEKPELTRILIIIITVLVPVVLVIYFSYKRKYRKKIPA